MRIATKIIKREMIADNTLACHILKPEGFEFKAGQYIDLTLIEPPVTDQEGNTRTYSIASAPYEDDLIIATRLRDTAFKRVLRTDSFHNVEIDGPMGSFTLHINASRPAVFIAGGIGITPFRSIAMDASRRRLPHEIILFSSNRRPEDAAFLEEAAALEKENPKYKFVGTMSGMGKSRRSWTGETGHINMDMLKRHIDINRQPVFYVAGPPQLVTAMRAMLNSGGIIDDDMRTEEFAGYS